MDPLKLAIFTEIRKQFPLIKNESDEELHKLIFHHSDGMRLMFGGFIRLKKIFTAYSFEIPVTLKAKHHMGMEKMTYPYYVTDKRLILFSEMDAMVIKLHGGIEGFLENCLNTEK